MTETRLNEAIAEKDKRIAVLERAFKLIVEDVYGDDGECPQTLGDTTDHCCCGYGDGTNECSLEIHKCWLSYYTKQAEKELANDK